MPKPTFIRQHRATSSLAVEAGGSPASLEQRLSEGPLPPAEALRYTVGLAEALRETHRRGRVYGSLHPGGIAIIEGQVRLLPSTPVTLSAYFSPEQVAGHDMDWRSDIFSLGAILYEMLAGRKAFRATSRPALRVEILNADPGPLENVPAALASLVHRCLEKKPERRIQRVEILLAALKLHSIVGSSSGDRSVGAETLDKKASPMARWMPPPVALAPLREKVDSICPMCGTFDVYTSGAVGWWETKLVRLGCGLHRCYSCYERYLLVAGMVVRRPGPPVIWVYPDSGRSARD